MVDPGPPYEVLWHPDADVERAAVPDPAVFVILAVAPEAQIDKRGFDESIRHAKQRLEGLET